MKKKITFLFLMIAGSIISGCGTEQQVIPNQPLCISNTLASQAMEAAQAVLLKMHFDIEKYDTDALYIRTRPLSGAQFFEFWRQDNASAASTAQANLSSIRRIVEMDFTQQPSEICVQCRVKVLRLSMPEKPIRGTGRMSEIYTKRNTLEVDLKEREQVEWIDSGQDADLERVILEKIQQQIQKGVNQ